MINSIKLDKEQMQDYINFCKEPKGVNFQCTTIHGDYGWVDIILPWVDLNAI